MPACGLAPSREVIADSVELTMRGHAYDALVGLAGCDKSLPGMIPTPPSSISRITCRPIRSKTPPIS